MKKERKEIIDKLGLHPYSLEEVWTEDVGYVKEEALLLKPVKLFASKLPRGKRLYHKLQDKRKHSFILYYLL
ncbi:MAG: hypothetical protein IJS97_08770 [Prevotella sp.]|nr:hypothetical protein [Prevotella sp.]